MSADSTTTRTKTKVKKIMPQPEAAAAPAAAPATATVNQPAAQPESPLPAVTQVNKSAARPNPARGPFPDLSIRFSGIELKNPVIAASGTFGYGIEFEDIASHASASLPSLSTAPRSTPTASAYSPWRIRASLTMIQRLPGNPPPRIFETAAGMLNSIGLQNIGARAFVEEKLPLLRKKKDVVVICNVFGYTRQDYEAVIRILNEGEGIAAYELNVSCPNTSHGGITFGSDPVLLEEVVVSAKNAAGPRPIIVKLSPNVTSIPRMAHAAENAGADAISLVNTFVAMAIDAESRKPRISNITAGLSGPAIKPIALRMVYEAAHAVDIPVIGLGGISTAEDVIEFMLAGAAAVQVGTANYWDPCATEKIVEGVRAWCIEHRVERITDLIGGLET